MELLTALVKSSSVFPEFFVLYYDWLFTFLKAAAVMISLAFDLKELGVGA